VTAFTLTYGLGAPVLAVLTSRWSRTRVLVIAPFYLANVGSTLAPTFPLLFLTRILAGACAATHSPLVYATSTQLVSPEKRERALALVVSGFTLATVLGSPLGTWIGEYGGWRWSFTLVALLAGSACVALLVSRLSRAAAQPSLVGAEDAYQRDQWVTPHRWSGLRVPKLKQRHPLLASILRRAEDAERKDELVSSWPELANP
jgi:DHA1 family inner membrane transport protein